MKNFKVLTNNISIADYKNLRAECGLSEKTKEASKTGLENTLFSVSLLKDSLLVGMGRVIGDKGTFAEIVDICMHPDYRNREMETLLMENLMTYTHTLPKTCFISLNADKETEDLYRKFGFKKMPAQSVGMFLEIE